MPLRLSALPLDPELRQTTAKSLFNYTWSLLEKADRTPADDELMVDAAHGSRLFWGEFSTPLHNARSEWQLSRVYSVLGRPEPALRHANQSLKICQENGIADFDLAYAYEALARASRVAEAGEDVTTYLAAAREAAAHIVKPDDRDLVLGDLDDLS